jgi:hypothetical protein
MSGIVVFRNPCEIINPRQMARVPSLGISGSCDFERAFFYYHLHIHRLLKADQNAAATIDGAGKNQFEGYSRRRREVAKNLKYFLAVWRLVEMKVFTCGQGCQYGIVFLVHDDN